jgi:hypothetical protein
MLVMMSSSLAPASAASKMFAHRMLAAAQKPQEFVALGLAQFDSVTYIHRCLFHIRGGDEQRNRMAGVSRPAKPLRPSRGNIWRLSMHTRA